MRSEIKNTTINKNSNPIRVALVIILTMINLLTPIGMFLYLFLFTHTVLGVLQIGTLFAQYVPVAFVLAFINFKAIVYYKSKLRPHLITNALFFVILFILTINMIYYVLDFIAAILWAIQDLIQLFIN